MPLTSPITIYDPEWPRLYKDSIKPLSALFESALIEFHHVGSTSVPGLAGKSEIDILAVVHCKFSETDWSSEVGPLGYRRGEDLSVGHQFYKRNYAGIRTHKLHVCVDGHYQIEWMLGFRDLLRRDLHLCKEYETLKRQLEKSNLNGMAEYLEQKAPFIEAAMMRRRTIE